MAVAYDSENHGNEGSAVSSTSFAITFSGSPNIVVCTGMYMSETGSNVTVGGGDTTLAIGSATTGASEQTLMYRVSPANGNVVMGYLFSYRAIYGASAYTGCNTSDPLGVTGFANGSAEDWGVTVTSETSTSLLVDSSCKQNTTDDAATASGTGQTKIYGQEGLVNNLNSMLSSYTIGVGGSQTVSYNGAVSGTYGIVVMEILAEGGGGTTTNFLSLLGVGT